MTGWDRGGVAATKWALLAGVSLAAPAALAQAGPATTTAATGGSQVAVNSPNGTSQSGAGDQIEEIVVTAQKRSENLQRVPISIQALSTQRLSELNITQVEDVIRFLPSVDIQTRAPGFTQFNFRGVTSGGDGNHSGPLPTVGVYLDDNPVTTIQGPVDIHFYDIARVEALAGPQGTLYGASSEAGVLRFITNKPDPAKFAAGVNMEGNSVQHGGLGYKAEGFANVPLSEHAAIRLVGWYERDAGFIDNAPGSRTYKAAYSGAVVDNVALGTAGKDINHVDTYGGRAALKIDLSDNWTITPSIQGQEQIIGGRFGYNPAVGDLQTRTFYPERAKDDFYQAAMTIEGKFHDFDLVYAGSYLYREIESRQDYNDYSFFYDTMTEYSKYFQDNAGKFINPSQQVLGNDKFTKQSHEIRLTTPTDYRLRGTFGLFYQRQQHNIEQNYFVQGLADVLSNTNRPGTVWLTEQRRVDRDYAVFGEVAFDIVPEHLTLTGGARAFQYDNTLFGYFGYGLGSPLGSSGEKQCNFALPVLPGAFCTNLPRAAQPAVPATEGNPGKAAVPYIDPRSKDSGITPRVNLTYKFDKDHLAYFTYSRGFRPGGVNRRGGQKPYLADFLTNFEVGAKNSFFDRRLQLNLAAYYENWKNFQFSFLGLNGLTEIRNLIGAAHIYGVEGDFVAVPVRGLTVSGAAAYAHATTANPYCGTLDPVTGNPVTVCPGAEQAPTGQRLPVTPEFKFNLTTRYVFTLKGLDLHVQGTVTHQSSAYDDLRTIERGILGAQRPYEQVDFSVGGQKGRTTAELFIQNAFDTRGQITRYAECAAAFCGPVATYIVPTRPQTIGIRIGQRY